MNARDLDSNLFRCVLCAFVFLGSNVIFVCTASTPYKYNDFPPAY